VLFTFRPVDGNQMIQAVDDIFNTFRTIHDHARQLFTQTERLLCLFRCWMILTIGNPEELATVSQSPADGIRCGSHRTEGCIQFVQQTGQQPSQHRLLLGIDQLALRQFQFLVLARQFLGVITQPHFRLLAFTDVADDPGVVTLVVHRPRG